MQSCCIRGCDSYKQTTVKNIGYFKFPLHDVFLLKKWLRQINRPNWTPSEISQICSVHFKEDDLDRRTNVKHPVLSPGSVPTIFPIKRKTGRKRRIGDEEISELENDELKRSGREIEGFEPHRNKVSLLRRKPIISVAQGERQSDIESKLNNILAKRNTVNDVELVTSDILTSQKPYSRITMNKKINNARFSEPEPFETIFLPYHEENNVAPEIVEVVNEECISVNNPNRGQSSFSIHDHSTYSKSAISGINRDRSKPHVRQYINKFKPKDSLSPQTHLRFDPKTICQDRMYGGSSAVKVQSLNSKTRLESDQLRRRLGELRERRKREQLKIVRLQMHLVELEKKMKENNHEEIILPNLGQGSKLTGTKSSWLIKEKEEYEKLLKDVREMKLKVLRERHNRELEKIRTLQIQMTNLSQRMKENDEKEIALSNFREINSSAVVRPDWMIREEEEYEKLLQDVRKIKQSYKMRKTNEQNDSTKVLECEKLLSNKECTLIETIQQENRSMEEIENNNRLIHKIEAGIELIDNNDEYGEVIGEIDEDSIDIDMTKDATMLTFTEELPYPGLLDS